ncbi:hypothetical protein [uncultured Desulfobacter sp.]|uniref:hypothetical protein n=1 Tax=uncultured Desulfobacter sp. TaxID=240139 RepID=UPI0029F531D8|nr:hypothetical protein [uncultured Desulfobacter sp.]
MSPELKADIKEQFWNTDPKQRQEMLQWVRGLSVAQRKALQRQIQDMTSEEKSQLRQKFKEMNPEQKQAFLEGLISHELNHQ